MTTAEKTSEKAARILTKQKRREHEATKGATSGRAFRTSQKLTERVNDIAKTYAKFKDLEGSRLIYDEALGLKFDMLAGDLKSKETIHQISSLASLEMTAIVERYETEGGFSRIFDEKIKETRKSIKTLRESMKDDIKDMDKNTKKILKKVENRQFSSIPQMMEKFGLDKPAEKLEDLNIQMADFNTKELIDKFIKIKADELVLRQLGNASKVLSAASKDPDALAKAKAILKENEPSYYREMLEGHLNNKMPSWGAGPSAGASTTGAGTSSTGGGGVGPRQENSQSHQPNTSNNQSHQNVAADFSAVDISTSAAWIAHAKEYYYGSKAEYSARPFGKRPAQANGFVHWAPLSDVQKAEFDELFKKLDTDKSMTTAIEIWKKINVQWLDSTKVMGRDEKLYFYNEIRLADTTDKAEEVWRTMMPSDARYHKKDMIEWLTQNSEKKYNRAINEYLEDQEEILAAIRKRAKINGGVFTPTAEEKKDFQDILHTLDTFVENVVGDKTDHKYLQDYLLLYSHMMTLHYTEDYSSGIKSGTLWEKLTGNREDPADTYFQMYSLRHNAYQKRKLSNTGGDDIDMQPMASPTEKNNMMPPPPPPPPA